MTDPELALSPDVDPYLMRALEQIDAHEDRVASEYRETVPDWYLADCLRAMAPHRFENDETVLRIWRAYMATAPEMVSS